MKIAVITGGSSGIGLETAKLFSKNGYKVYEISRSGKGDENITHITGDVTDEKSIQEIFEQIHEKERRIDVLVNNAGFGISGPIELTELNDAKKQLDVNFFGSFICAKAVCKYMRKQRNGKIIFVSSMAAPLSIPFQAFYSASKAAINSLSAALANELRQFNIKVCAVMPGDIKTGFTAAREKSFSESGEYQNVLEKSISTMENDEQNGMSPEKIAKKIFSLAQKKNPKPVSTVGLKYKVFASLAKILPARAVNNIIGMIYAK